MTTRYACDIGFVSTLAIYHFAHHYTVQTDSRFITLTVVNAFTERVVRSRLGL